MKKRCALFTLQRDEVEQLPRWWAYYSRHFDPQDIWILDHDSVEPPVLDFLVFAREAGVHVVRLGHGDTYDREIFDHEWLVQRVMEQQRALLADYEYVLFTDADELVIPAEGSLRHFIDNATDECYRCTGIQVVGEHQFPDVAYSKTLLTRVPLKYVWGYHTCENQPPPNPDLFLYHLHQLSYDEALEKNWRWGRQQWNQEAVDGGYSIQSQLVDIPQFSAWYYRDRHLLEPMHDRLRVELRRGK